MKSLKGRWAIFVMPALFFLVSILTLPHYGISWDEPSHFIRGQAYVDFFLTGDSSYSKLSTYPRRSYYQDYSESADYFFERDSGHPPLNGILAALFNKILYQKLGVMGDIESHHLFNILSATLLVFVVVAFATQAYGRFAGLIAGLSLALYPLFFSEAHFNIKDPPEAAFFAATIWTFWVSLKKTSWQWLLASVLFTALALGTKFNILFLPFILIPWFAIRYGSDIKDTIAKWPRKFLIVLVISPLVIGGLFFATWPYLWQDPIVNTVKILRYYVDIGTGGRGQPQFILPGGFNSFPLVWIVTTTPPVILFLSTLGILSALFRYKEKEKTAYLWLFWLVVPVLRVSIPNSSVYGGIRQIMEFVPALALLAGLGAFTILNWLKKAASFSKVSGQVVILLLFIPHLWVMTKLHPNENVYFNFFVGGIRGAQALNVPYWGNSFGNAYYQAIQWLNKNAEPESRLGLVQGTGLNIPKIYLRRGIAYSNSFWSGINREGEYLLELTHQGNEIAYLFAWDYVNTVLVPVYEVKVDGVAIAKLWKNDIEHSREEYKNETDLPLENVKKTADGVEIKLQEIYSLARLNAEFNGKGDCQPFTSGEIAISSDGIDWRTEPERISDQQVVAYPSLEGGTIRYIFPGRKAGYIRIKIRSGQSCLFQNLKVAVRGFEI
ncbi:MAG: glycosyltransferase family 39 protein [bacterium]|nr:glycosyltransferase family 39 protein [bacterium]